MDLNRIAELRQAETICLLSENETNITRSEFEELLDAAELEAMLRQASGVLLTRFWPAQWVYSSGENRGRGSTPREAMLAALRGKEHL